MGQFEREVNRALEIFVATVTGVAERLTVEALRSAFVRGSHHTSGHAVAPAGNEVPAPSKELHHRREPTSAAPAAVSADRLVIFIRENPGWRSGQIARYLGIHTSKLRPLLRKLVADGTIRIEERAVGTSERKYRTYLVVEHVSGERAVEHVNGERAEPSVMLAEATA
jgi:hypothetical protein